MIWTPDFQFLGLFPQNFHWSFPISLATRFGMKKSDNRCEVDLCGFWSLVAEMGEKRGKNVSFINKIQKITLSPTGLEISPKDHPLFSSVTRLRISDAKMM